MQFLVKLTPLPSHFVTNLGPPSKITSQDHEVVIIAYRTNCKRTFEILQNFNRAKYLVLNKMFWQLIGLGISVASEPQSALQSSYR